MIFLFGKWVCLSIIVLIINGKVVISEYVGGGGSGTGKAGWSCEESGGDGRVGWAGR